MSAPVWTEENDRISDDGLAAVFGLFDKLPESWEFGHMQGAQKSVTATLRFDPMRDPMSQVEALENCMQAAACLGTLARNLQREREKTARLEAELADWEERHK